MSGTDESRRSNPYLFPGVGYVQFPYCSAFVGGVVRPRPVPVGCVRADDQAATFTGAVFRSQYSPTTGRTSGMKR